MPLNSALVFNLAQVPINSEQIKLSTTQPVIVAQPNVKPLEVKKANSDWTILGTSLIVVMGLVLLAAIFKEQISSLMGEDGQSQEEFAVSLKISNVRTKDYFRAEIQGTVYIKINDDKKFTSLKSKDGIITNDTVAKFFKDTFESAIREAASDMELVDIHTDRKSFREKVEKVLDDIVDGSYLSVKSVVIGGVDESNNYDPTNYFDAEILEDRTEKIQSAIEVTRTKEIETQETVKKKELQFERDMRKEELNYEQEIEALELGFKQQHLTNNKILEKAKIDCEFEVESYKETKENELEKTIETAEIKTMKEIEEYRATEEKAIQKAKEEIEIAEIEKEKNIEKKEITKLKEIEEHKATEEEKIQIAKGEIEIAAIKRDKAISEANKLLQIQQKQEEQEIERAEITAIIETIIKEIDKLEKEEERAVKLEAITTSIEKAQVERENEKTQLVHEGLKNETAIITQMATAEEQRYKAVPLSDFDSLIKLIRDELLGGDHKAKLTEIKGILQALAPQKGVLGDSSVYTFSNSDGEDINKLMLSTSGMHLIQSFLNSQLGKQLQDNLSNHNGAIKTETTDSN